MSKDPNVILHDDMVLRTWFHLMKDGDDGTYCVNNEGHKQLNYKLDPHEGDVDWAGQFRRSQIFNGAIHCADLTWACGFRPCV